MTPKEKKKKKEKKNQSILLKEIERFAYAVAQAEAQQLIDQILGKGK